MFQKIRNLIKKHKLLTGIAILIIIGGIYYFYNSLTQTQAATSYVLAAVTKGTLITSISGSGQVSASDQVDVKAKASGDAIYIGVQIGQEVKTGALLAQLNSRDAQSAVNDAEISLESAKIDLDKLLAGSDAQSLVQAENAVAQAERDLEKTQENYDNIATDSEENLQTAYYDGYSNVTNSFIKLSDYMTDLQDVLGTKDRSEKYLDSYKILLGTNSGYIQRLLDDYNNANNLYNDTFTFFRGVFRDSNRDTIYQLIADTLQTNKAISQALESAGHMYDEIVVHTYSQLSAASQIDSMQPKIKSDISAALSTETTLKNSLETIDAAIKNTPGNIKDSKLALDSAKEKLEEKKTALTDLQAGADALDIRTQQNTVAQKEAALSDAKQKLADTYIRAPFNGIAADVKIKKGDSVSVGTAVATIITKQQIAEISLNEVDAAKVKVGQKATLTFDAIEGLSIAGQVADIDMIGTVTQGVVSYNVKISFDTQDNRIKPGMSATAQIIIEAKPDVLLVPNSAIKINGGTSYVEIFSNEQMSNFSASISQSVTSSVPPNQQPVETGISNDTSTEITSGLKEGDQIVSRTITSSSQSTTSQAPSLFGGGSSGGNTFRAIER